MIKLLILLLGLCKFSNPSMSDTKISICELAENTAYMCGDNRRLVNNFTEYVVNPIKPTVVVCAELEYQMGYCGLYSDNPTCAMCGFITGIVRYQVLQANATLAVIEDIIKVICATQPFIRKECYFYLDSIQDIINWIVAGLTDEQICEKLAMC